ncbi:hypothetical protein HELRODRAFT_162165 [Helobdella robusta]|uniref:Coiled coil protein 74 C-terminal domain-containing protein n=1 Tax=Helobdella robusta TaxID=6412 RepID=T1ESB0_HELRO|nr:hypothetical protein HELRODRAFT_162165 [Helobdella robusta]ESN98713.1 hypothetical protein HELRODRAFT_162165 [Helobdella robusta]
MQLHNEINDLKETLKTFRLENDKLTSTLERYKNRTDCSDDPKESKPELSDTRDECRYIVEHLNEVNQQNLKEIREIKAHLEDVVNSEKVSLNAFMLAKGCNLSNEPTTVVSNKPLLSLHHNDHRKSRQSTQNQEVVMLLPPLKQTAKSRMRDKVLTFRPKPHFRP